MTSAALYLGTHLSAFHDEVSGHLQLPRYLLQPGRGDPGGRVMRIGLPHRLQQEASLLDVAGRAEGGGEDLSETLRTITEFDVTNN